MKRAITTISVAVLLVGCASAPRFVKMDVSDDQRRDDWEACYSQSLSWAHLGGGAMTPVPDQGRIRECMIARGYTEIR